jgi:phytoene/squalene synthetase
MTRLNAIVARVRRWLAAADRGLMTLRDTLTPGQRWTAALVMALTVLVLYAGLPRRGP